MQEFNFFDEVKKSKILSDEGVFLSERIEGCYRISLYQIESFYVEIFYHMTRYFYIALRSFEEVGALEPYLDQVDISEIYSELS